MHTYIYIYTLFHHTELTSVLPHRWPSFTTLGKPTIWMVTYLSPPYTPTCTHIHTNILFVLQITHHHTHAHIYIYIYIDIYSVSTHRVKYLFYRTDSPPSCICIHICSVSPHRVNICFTAQMAQFYHTGETNNLDGDLFITVLYTHMYTRTHIYCLFYR